MPKHDDSRLKCSFCGKSQDQVKKLIAGPEVYICDECVELCNQILDEEFFENKDKEGGEGAEAAVEEKPIPKQSFRQEVCEIALGISKPAHRCEAGPHVPGC